MSERLRLVGVRIVDDDDIGFGSFRPLVPFKRRRCIVAISCELQRYRPIRLKRAAYRNRFRVFRLDKIEGDVRRRFLRDNVWNGLGVDCLGDMSALVADAVDDTIAVVGYEQ